MGGAVESGPLPEFRPARGLASPHVQTVAGKLLRPRLDVPLRRERLETPDGDFLDVDFAGDPYLRAARAGSSEGDAAGSSGAGAFGSRGADGVSSAPVVVVLHGLEGRSTRRYMGTTYRALLERGMRPVGLNFRGCSGEPNRTARAYHSGETGDLRFVLETLRARFGGPFGVVGYSLGGNVALKFLGEMGAAGGSDGGRGENSAIGRRPGSTSGLTSPGDADPETGAAPDHARGVEAARRGESRTGPGSGVDCGNDIASGAPGEPGPRQPPGASGASGPSGEELVAAGAAVSVPFDLAAGATALEGSLMGRLVYTRYFMGGLRSKMLAKGPLVSDLCDLDAVRRSRTIREFDDAATAPIFGFESAAHYYESESSNRFIAGIRVPTLVVHSRDDPFLPADAIPEAALDANPRVTPLITDRGGHQGYVAGSLLRPRFWVEEVVADFMAAHLVR